MHIHTVLAIPPQLFIHVQQILATQRQYEGSNNSISHWSSYFCQHRFSIWNLSSIIFLDLKHVESVPLSVTECFNLMRPTLSFYRLVGTWYPLCKPHRDSVWRSLQLTLVIICLRAKSRPSAEDTLCAFWTIGWQETGATPCLQPRTTKCSTPLYMWHVSCWEKGPGVEYIPMNLKEKQSVDVLPQSKWSFIVVL